MQHEAARIHKLDHVRQRNTPFQMTAAGDGALILLLYGAPWLDGMVFAAAVFAVTLVWQVVAIRAYRRSRQPVYDGGHGD